MTANRRECERLLTRYEIERRSQQAPCHPIIVKSRRTLSTTWSLRWILAHNGRLGTIARPASGDVPAMERYRQEHRPCRGTVETELCCGLTASTKCPAERLPFYAALFIAAIVGLGIAELDALARSS